MQTPSCSTMPLRLDSPFNIDSPPRFSANMPSLLPDSLDSSLAFTPHQNSLHFLSANQNPTSQLQNFIHSNALGLSGRSNTSSSNWARNSVHHGQPNQYQILSVASHEN